MRRLVNADDASEILRSGGALIFDTDTVPGIGISTEHPESIGMLYEAKCRDRQKPIAWLVGSASDLHAYGREVGAEAIHLAKAFWPGPLTLIVKAADEIDAALISDTGSVGLRMPDDEACISLICSIGCPIATTSANISGQLGGATALDIDDSFAPGVAMLDPRDAALRGCAIKPGQTSAPKASTVIDCTGVEPCLKREGAIPFFEIEKVLGRAKGDATCA